MTPFLTNFRDSGFERPRPLIPQTAIRDTGADNIALVLQGLLVAGDRVAEAGLSALPKVHQKAESPSPQATKNNDGAVSTEVAALDQ
jgi:hypothetical protein